MRDLENRIFSIQSSTDFQNVALDVFKFQAQNCSVYKRYIELVKCVPTEIKAVEDIPFLPIQFFKTHEIRSFSSDPEIEFSSSGTTGMQTSKHAVYKLSMYEKSFQDAFYQFYPNGRDLTILALLPNYLEREGSSLIYMVDALIKQSKSAHSGFYLDDYSGLINRLEELEKQQNPVLLLGVSYALLDLIEMHSFKLNHTLVMETGGMKGRRKEMIKSELHAVLKEGFGVSTIHSEYGMTELLSQAYSQTNERFLGSNWMKILIRDANDPFCLLPSGQTGGINVIDLANLYSCSFIATQDLGKVHPDQSFEVLGRFDNSDIRGCNLLVQ